ncbi:MAG: tRNA uridine-5-carboxymethylaminomethyl(34) synthesis GTPase MnmE [Desulfovibrionaceae bacterium]|nr:tRNA uridine-5-carboxymethylaminomethyl(34) synthesis GTPase MnmE [Desulfovibrionaceae bacterium]
MPGPARTETIAAIATGKGAGGIGIIRISGPSSLQILHTAFEKSGKPGFSPRRLEHGWVLDSRNRRLDEALAVYMPEPRSFTGEDTAEIHCHGGRAVLEAALESALWRGARAAGPGEFTRRALLNGRLDLSRAEAIGELIAAPTLEAARLARNKLEGRLSAALKELRQKMDSLRAFFYAAMDFPESALPPDQSPEAQKLLKDTSSGLASLAASWEQARVWRQGALTVLAGPPNTGKSSLFNAMLERPRALVTELPGTTRDFLEESLLLEGIPLRLADTAGLRVSEDATEKAGMDLTLDLLEQAEIILLVLDAARPEQVPPPWRLEQGRLLNPYRGAILILLNKIDLLPARSKPPLPEELWGCRCLPVSALTGQGLPSLRARLGESLTAASAGLDFNEAAPPSLRQMEQIRLALAELEKLAQAQNQGLPPELLAACLDSAAACLDESLGLSCSQEILDRIFAQFCVGK